MMRTARSTPLCPLLALTLTACLAQPARLRPAADGLDVPRDSVIVAYEAGRHDAAASKRRGGPDVLSWLAFPAGLLAAKATGADWMRAATSVAISAGSVGVAYHRRAHGATNPPDSLRARWIANARAWAAYRRGYQSELVRGRRSDLNRASEAAGGTILSYGVAPLFTKSNHP